MIAHFSKKHVYRNFFKTAAMLSCTLFAHANTAHAKKVNINTKQNEAYNFSQHGEILTLSSGGSIDVGGHDNLTENLIYKDVPAIAADHHLNNLTINIDANSAQSSISSIGEKATISMANIGGDFALNLHAGSISSIIKKGGFSTIPVPVIEEYEPRYDDRFSTMPVPTEDAGRRYSAPPKLFNKAIDLNRDSNTQLNAVISLGENAVINGNIEFGDTVDITINNEGTINGNIVNNTRIVHIINPGYSGQSDIAINNTGSMTGNIQTGYKINIDNSGSIQGNVSLGGSAESSFSLHDTGSLVGDLSSTHAAHVINLNSGSVTGDINFAGHLNLGSISNFKGDISTNGGAATLNLGTSSHRINGSLSLNKGDSLSVAFRDDGSLSRIIVNDDARIDQDVYLNVQVDRNIYLEDGSTHVIVQGNKDSLIHAIKDTNIDVNSSGNNKAFRVLAFTTSATNDDLLLNVQRMKASDVTQNKNAQEAYKILQTIGGNASGNLKELQLFLDNASSQADVITALKSLTPQDESSTTLNNIAIINDSIATTEDRLDEFHIASLKASNPFNGFNAAQQKGNSSSGISSGDAALHSEIWGQTFGVKAKQKNDNDSGYNSTSLGFAFGLDRKIDKDSRVGVSVSYADSQISSSNGSKTTNVDSYQINLYAGRSFDRYFIDGILGATWNDYDSYRFISAVNSTANAKYNGQNYIAKIRVGSIYDNIAQSGVSIAPEISSTFINSATDAYVENGADTLNLQVGNNHNEFWEARAGMVVSKDAIEIGSFEFAPRLNLSYGYNFLNKDQTTISSFAGQTSVFNTVSSSVSPISIKWGTGLDIYNASQFTTSLDYSNERRGGYVSHTGNIKFKYLF